MTISGNGKDLTLTGTMTMTSINQPVKITAPPASETTPLPASLLS